MDASLSLSSAERKGARRWGLSPSMDLILVRVVARTGFKAGHSDESRWATSPGATPQPGRRQAPDSWVQWRLSQQDLYLPLSILAWTVAALTADGEDPQVCHRGCAPWPGGRKANFMYLRLLRLPAWRMRCSCQKQQMAFFTLTLNRDFLFYLEEYILRLATEDK